MKHSDYRVPSFDRELLVIRELGSNQAAKKCVLFVHGLGGDKEAWELCIQKFQSLDREHDYRMFSYDLRGHGKSTRKIYDDLPLYKTYSADLKVVVDFISSQTHPASIVIVGHSFGSFIVQQYAHDFLHPLVKKLVLISAPSKSRGWRLPHLFRLVHRYLPSGRIIHRSKKDYEKFIGSGDFDVGRILSDIRSVGLANYILLETMVSGSRVAGISKKITIPTYVLCGEKDSYFPLSSMEKFQKEIRAKEFIIFHDTNHIVPINKAEKLAEALFSIVEDV